MLSLALTLELHQHSIHCGEWNLEVSYYLPLGFTMDAFPMDAFPMANEAKFVITHLPCNTNVPCNEPATLKIISFNTEGFTAAKSELIPELCASENSDILCLQETHRDSSQTRRKINGMTLINELPHAQHGSAIFQDPTYISFAPTKKSEART